MQTTTRRLALTGLAILFLAFRASPAAEADPPSTVRVAGLVLKWIRADKEANYRRVEPMIRKAATDGAKIICTTECFLDGYAIADKSIPLEQYRALGEPIPEGKYFQRLTSLAKELKIYLDHIVFVHPAEFLVTGPDGSNLANTLLGDRLLIQPDEAGTEKDANRVFYFDLPLRRKEAGRSRRKTDVAVTPCCVLARGTGPLPRRV